MMHWRRNLSDATPSHNPSFSASRDICSRFQYTAAACFSFSNKSDIRTVEKKKTVEIQQSGKNNKATNNNKEKLKL
jgi:hypothetical protein